MKKESNLPPKGIKPLPPPSPPTAKNCEDLVIACRELEAWWKDAQYWVKGEYGGHNIFDDDDEAVFENIFEILKRRNDDEDKRNQS